MSKQTVISVENLGKAYRINHHVGRPRYVSLRDVVTNKFKGLLKSARPHSTNVPSQEDFWALRDIGFEVKQGDVLGIIGRNGAGKSTLLKILSRITEPSEGRVRIKGRVASLLEVGTGFHPELTGRENIFLNGAILGMSRLEIKGRFDEIVDFAEVEKFLDTPVKFYSSGMYVRLAFAVAAHLEPEILIVDEVLAVGDSEFQKKCLGKMDEVAKGKGRSVLFVSHNMAVIQALCPKVIVLEAGKLKFIGDSLEAAASYLGAFSKTTVCKREASSTGNPTITIIELTAVRCDQSTVISFNIAITSQKRKSCSLEVRLFDGVGVPIGLASAGLLNAATALHVSAGITELACRITLPRMARGTYRLSAALALPMVEFLDTGGEGIFFDLHPTPLDGYERVMEASWGYGPFEAPFEIEQLSIHG